MLLLAKQTLIKLGPTKSTYGESIFTNHSNDLKHLHGIITDQTDDLCETGSKHFQEPVIDGIRKPFHVNTEENTNLKYLGVNIFHATKDVVIKQDKNARRVKLIKYPLLR